MRRHASVWAVGMQPRNAFIPEAEDVVLSEGHSDGGEKGESPLPPAGWTTIARTKEDDSETWEALTLSLAGVCRRQGTTVASTDGVQGVAGLHKSVEVGELLVTGPDGAKAVRVGTVFRRETWLMLGHRRTCHRNF